MSVEPNFYDELTGQGIFIPKYIVKIKNGKSIYINKETGEELIGLNGLPLKPVTKKGIPNFLVSNQKEKRVEMLKKRSKEHFKKKIKERKDEMLSNAKKKFKNL